jgi:hypothetical protein
VLQLLCNVDEISTQMAQSAPTGEIPDDLDERCNLRFFVLRKHVGHWCADEKFVVALKRINNQEAVVKKLPEPLSQEVPQGMVMSSPPPPQLPPGDSEQRLARMEKHQDDLEQQLKGGPLHRQKQENSIEELRSEIAQLKSADRGRAKKFKNLFQRKTKCNRRQQDLPPDPRDTHQSAEKP